MQNTADDRVVLWNTELAIRKGYKLWKPCLGSHAMTERLGRVGSEITSPVSNWIARVHANRLRKIHNEAVQTKKPEKVVFLDCMRGPQRAGSTMEAVVRSTGQRERKFKVRVSRRCLAK